MELLEWPGKLPSRIWMPDEDHSYQREPPEGIVIHSGAIGPDLAGAAKRMKISYHFAHSTEHGQLVQMVSMRRRAWHAGPKGNHWLSVALQGPWDKDPRTDAELLDFRLLMKELQEAFNGSLKFWCRHSDIEARKKDPGPGFDESWIRGFGLEWRRAWPSAPHAFTSLNSDRT